MVSDAFSPLKDDSFTRFNRHKRFFQQLGYFQICCSSSNALITCFYKFQTGHGPLNVNKFDRIFMLKVKIIMKLFFIKWLLNMVGLLYLFNINFFHLKHCLHHALNFFGIRVTNHLHQCNWRNLP